MKRSDEMRFKEARQKKRNEDTRWDIMKREKNRCVPFDHKWTAQWL